MRLIVTLLALATGLSALGETIVFRNVNVVSMTSPRAVPNQTVIVRDGRIESVARKAAIPKGAVVIDGTGKFLMPGLAEMHGHIPPMSAGQETIEDVLFLYLAGGITTVRGMLGHEGQLELRSKAKSGELLAPNLYLAGPTFAGQTVSTVEGAIQRVRQQKAEGWDLLKVHPGLEREVYDAMADTAREEGMRFGGHVPSSVGLLHAIEKGQETFDHIDGYIEFVAAPDGAIDEKKLAEAISRSKAAGVWIVPTSALWEVLFGTIPLETLRSYDELKYVPESMVESWVKSYNARLEQIPRDAAAKLIANRVRLLRALHEGGVKILMGTDAPQQFSVPGFSLHRELQRMREAGMSPYDILKSGTVNVGAYFAKSDSFGTIETGRRADLVLLDANPLENIANVAKLSGVMVRGRWVSRSELDERLERIERKHARTPAAAKEQ